MKIEQTLNVNAFYGIKITSLDSYIVYTVEALWKREWYREDFWERDKSI